MKIKRGFLANFGMNTSPELPVANTIRIQPLVSINEDLALNKKWTPDEKKIWIFTLFFGAMMMFAVRTVMSVCALEISKEFNYDKTQMATLLSSFFYGYPLTQIPGGYMSDKIGGDLMIFYAAIFWGTLTFLLPYVSLLSDSKYVVLSYITICRCLTGGFQGFHYPGTSSLVSKKIIESEKAFTFSFITSGQHLGTLFCGIFGSLILDRYGWRYTFQMVGVLSLIWVYYYRNYVLLKYRSKLNVFNAKDDLAKLNDSVSISLTGVGSASNSSSTSPSSSVPWMEFLNKPAFW